MGGWVGGWDVPDGGGEGSAHHPALPPKRPIIRIPFLVLGGGEKDEDEPAEAVQETEELHPIGEVFLAVRGGWVGEFLLSSFLLLLLFPYRIYSAIQRRVSP